VFCKSGTLKTGSYCAVLSEDLISSSFMPFSNSSCRLALAELNSFTPLPNHALIPEFFYLQTTTIWQQKSRRFLLHPSLKMTINCTWLSISAKLADFS